MTTPLRESYDSLCFGDAVGQFGGTFGASLGDLGEGFWDMFGGLFGIYS